MKRLGPELKMPKLKGGDVKVPPFLSDLFYDLRERRLLPLVALILVAIVAAPILLGGGSGEAEPSPSAVAPSGEGSSGSTASLTVVQAQPGLRNYKKRLAHRSPTNPFKQRFTAPNLKGAELNQQSTTTTTTTTTGSQSTGTESAGAGSESVTTPSHGASSGGKTGGGGSGGGHGAPAPPSGVTYSTFAIDLQISKTATKPDGGKETTGPTVHKEVVPPTTLPGRKAQVVTYIGTSSKTGKPLFVVSTDVRAIFGEAKCVAGSGVCQLLELEPGFPVTLVYGENGVRYKLQVIKVYPKATGRS
ncbi:MAG: hypothetical protein ACM3NV_10260 [Syntrophothermus sp.]